MSSSKRSRRRSAGDILVADNAGRLDEACIGDLMVLDAAAGGVAGVVIWGLHRDTADLLRDRDAGVQPRLPADRTAAARPARRRRPHGGAGRRVDGDGSGCRVRRRRRRAVRSPRPGRRAAHDRRGHRDDRAPSGRPHPQPARACAIRCASPTTSRRGHPTPPSPSATTCAESAARSRSRALRSDR